MAKLKHLQNFRHKLEIESYLKRLGVSKSAFRRNMPRVLGSGLDFTLATDQKFTTKDKIKRGKKPSLRQQAEYLRRLVESYDEMKKFIDEEVKRVGSDSPQVEAPKENEPVFKTGEIK